MGDWPRRNNHLIKHRVLLKTMKGKKSKGSDDRSIKCNYIFVSLFYGKPSDGSTPRRIIGEKNGEKAVFWFCLRYSLLFAVNVKF